MADLESAESLETTDELFQCLYSCDCCERNIQVSPVSLDSFTLLSPIVVPTRQEGSTRYNCRECVESYDLCSSCYDRGEGKCHTQQNGYLHDFCIETRYDAKVMNTWFEVMNT